MGYEKLEDIRAFEDEEEEMVYCLDCAPDSTDGLKAITEDDLAKAEGEYRIICDECGAVLTE